MGRIVPGADSSSVVGADSAVSVLAKTIEHRSSQCIEERIGQESLIVWEGASDIDVRPEYTDRVWHMDTGFGPAHGIQQQAKPVTLQTKAESARSRDMHANR